MDAMTQGDRDAAEVNGVSGIDISNRVSTEELFGLIAFRAHFSTARQFDGAELHAVFGPASRIMPLSDAVDQVEVDHSASEGPPAWRVMVHVNTHQIPNGPQAIEISIQWPNGDITDFGHRDYVVANEGALSEAVKRDLDAAGLDPIFGATVDSGMFPYADGQAKVWFEKTPTPEVPLSFEPHLSLQASLDHMHRWGFTLLHEKLPQSMIDNFLQDLDGAISSGSIAYTEGSSDRIHQAHRMDSGRAIWLFPPVMNFLKAHFQDDPCACQTLTYMNGSEQSPHQDTIHLTPYPGGFMSGVWIALQDIAPDSGELVVYPGSHVSERLRAAKLGLQKVRSDYSTYAAFDARVRQIIEEEGYERAVYRPKAGHILVWSENLIHGGSYRIDRSLSRKSIVSHYFAKGAVGYYDSRGEAAGLEAVSA